MSTLLLEAVVEGKLVSAIAAKLVEAAITGVAVQGFWSPALEGDVKAANAGTGSIIFCRVPPRGYGSYGTPTVRFNAQIALEVLPSNDPACATLAPIFKCIMDLFMACTNDAAAAADSLSAANEFACDGVTIMPGGNINVTKAAWSVSTALEIAGTELETEL